MGEVPFYGKQTLSEPSEDKNPAGLSLSVKTSVCFKPPFMLLVMLLATWISSSTFSCSLHVIFNFWIHLIIPYITLVSQLFRSTYWAISFY